MTMRTITDSELQPSIQTEGVTLVDFSSPWCAPCKTLLPLLEELDQELAHQVAILKLNADESPDSCTRYSVLSMPTVIVFHNGMPVEKLIGLRPKAVYRTIIDKYMKA